MSQQAYVVLLEQDDAANPDAIAEQIQLLVETRFDVIRVSPWDSPGQSQLVPPTPTFPTL